MLPSVITLILSLLILAGASARTCISCNSVLGTNCATTTTTIDCAGSCQTITVDSFLIHSVFKGCIATCTPANLLGTVITCCDTDRCNGNDVSGGPTTGVANGGSPTSGTVGTGELTTSGTDGGSPTTTSGTNGGSPTTTSGTDGGSPIDGADGTGVAQGSSLCYACTYYTTGSSSDTSSCRNPNDQTPTITCTDGCKTSASSTSVTRGCAFCFFGILSGACDACTTDRCNNEVVKYVTCYKCTSTTDCASPVNGTTPTESCDGKCSKSVSSYGSTKTTTRKCSTSCSAGSASFFGISSSEYCCSSDLCNGSAEMLLSLAATITSALLCYLASF